MPDLDRPGGNPLARGIPVPLLLDLLRHVPRCVGVYALDGTCLAASPALGRWLQRPIDSLLGQGVDAVWGEFGPRIRARWQEAIRGRAERCLEEYPSAQGIRSVCVSRFVWRDGTEVRGVIEWFQEQHEPNRAETIGRLALGVVHDFNNALTLVQGHAELLELAMQPGAGVQPLLANLRKALDHACEMPRQLLRLVRDEPPATERIDANALLASLQKLLRPRLKRNVTFRLDTLPGGAWIEGDPGQLTQVFLNLASNALEAMPTGGELLIRVEAVGPMVRVRFSDTGCGMTPEVQDRLFEPLFTTRAGGTGLGLYLSREILHRHRGRITCQSSPAAGTTFTVELPCYDPPANSSARSATRAGSSVVVIEGDPEVRRLASLILEQGGYSSILCASVREARAALEADADRIRLLVLDAESTLGAGEDLVGLLSQFPAVRRLYLSTGHHLTRETHRSMGQHVLIKPFGPAQLLQAVESALAD